MNKNHPLRGYRSRAPLAMAVAVALLAAPAAHAFSFEKGEFTGSWDTTVTYGLSLRTQGASDGLKAKSLFNPLLCAQNIPLGGLTFPNAGRCSSTGGVPGSTAQLAAPGRFSANRDDGNLKYDAGEPISNAVKLTSELGVNWRDWGLFTRVSYFYDYENADRNDLTLTARRKVGEDFRLLDAFVFRNFDIGEDHSGTVRLGRQVISWGESTFIQNGINVINPVNLSALRQAGSELKEAFLPIDAVWGSVNLTDNISLEATYLFEFEEIEVDPAGTFFSSNDFGSPGGNYVMLGFGTTPQPVNNPENFFSTCFNGQAGFLSSDRMSELTAFYTANPGLIPAGVPNAATAAAFAVQVGCGNAVARAPNRPTSDNGQFGASVKVFAPGLGDTEFGFYYLNYHSRVPLLSGRAVTTSAASSGRFFVEYPEDIHLYGMSWNTTIADGVAFQGELTYRPNMPLQVDDVELLFAALTPLNAFIPQPSLRFQSQLGQFSPGEEIKGYRRNKVSQLQMTFTKLFPDMIGAEQVAVVGEIGATEVWDLPTQDVLRYEGEGTDTGGGCQALPDGCLRNPQTQNGGFPTQFSWGYRVAARADYNSAFGTPFTLSPRIAFNHDVNGTTPGPGGNFLEDRYSFTAGLEANYLQKWIFDISYTQFGGAKEFNQIHDRDFASFSVKYSF